MAPINVKRVNSMGTRLTNFVPRLNASVDWFIPEHLKQSRDVLQAVRMFLFSHLFGPFLGHTISLSMLFVGGQADLSWWIFFLAVTAFWPFAVVLRLTGAYVPLALLSIRKPDVLHLLGLLSIWRHQLADHAVAGYCSASRLLLPAEALDENHRRSPNRRQPRAVLCRV